MRAMTAADTSRRTFLAGGAALVGAVLAGCAGSSDDDGSGDASGSTTTSTEGTEATTGTTADAGATLTAADFASLGTCRLTPEQTEGPFYIDVGLERRDITEGLAGHPLRLGVRVVDADCNPVPGAVVDVWHADTAGDYSAFTDGSGGEDAGEGTTFLRGSQVADADGIVEFGTVYPGWYPGRAVHIHTKVRLDDAAVLTTQLYFLDDLTDEVHAEDPYAAYGTRDTRNEDDSIAGDPAANGNLLTTSAAGSGTLGLVVLGVDPEA
jgi:protocatechuate 3,4-dioxygenase beta subunit